MPAQGRADSYALSLIARRRLRQRPVSLPSANVRWPPPNSNGPGHGHRGDPYKITSSPGGRDRPKPATSAPGDALLEKYAQGTLDTEPPSASASDDEFRAWRARLRERAGTLIGEIRRDDEPDRKQIARQLAGLPDRKRIWGRDAGIKAIGRGNKRLRMTPALGGR